MLWTDDELVGTDGATRARFIERFRESSQIVYVPNTTVRAQHVSDITAAGYAPSTSNPVFVYRGDAPLGARTEVTEDGTNWRTYVDVGPWQAVTYQANWEADGIAPSVRFEGDMVVCRAARARRTSNLSVTAGTSYQWGTLPAGYYPADAVVIPAGMHLGSTTPVIGELVVLNTGTLSFRPGTTGTILYTSSPGQGYAMASWPRP